MINSETDRAYRGPSGVGFLPWMKLRRRDTPSSMESLFTLGDSHLRGAHLFCLPRLTRWLEAAELRRFVDQACD